LPKILIVDDDEVDREAAARCLEGLDDLELQVATDGAEALRAVSEIAPDLVLTDLRMPGMDGLELVEKLHDEHPLILVVLMTSYGNEKTAVQALKAGAASYVPKDDLQNELADTVEQVLEMMDARRSRSTILRCLERREMRFELDNDLQLISPLAGYVQESLERLGFGTDSIRTQVGMALMEAVSNAIIHGNLEVGSELRVDGTKPFYALIEQRRHETPYAERRARCISRESIDLVEYVVLDEGPGFDHAALPDPESPQNLTRVQGRGLMLIRTFMDEVHHNDRGNEITMRKHRTEPAP
jgi:CheY-like chemotaxis protein/anti-sigma regulatory factor (Ser/Thr protein kinase)